MGRRVGNSTGFRVRKSSLPEPLPVGLQFLWRDPRPECCDLPAKVGPPEQLSGYFVVESA